MRRIPAVRKLGLASFLVGALSVTQSVGRSENSRFFEMAILTYPYLSGGGTWQDTAPYADFGVFTSDNPGLQPPGYSIMLHERWLSTPLPSLSVDWSRILAVMIDEPYVTEIGDDPENPACGTGERHDTMNRLLRKIQDTAAQAHALAPRTRVWVNFHWQEVVWMRDAECPAPLNDLAIDVVSLDRYQVDFADIEQHYDWFVSRWPQQQLALVPAVSYTASGDDNERARAAARTARRLRGYFAYANEINGSKLRACDMPVRRFTGSGPYDRCRVWLVAGWSSVRYFDQGPGWYGMLRPDDEKAELILDEWASQFSRVRRSTDRTVADRLR
jgi:hypothetical protein